MRAASLGWRRTLWVLAAGCRLQATGYRLCPCSSVATCFLYSHLRARLSRLSARLRPLEWSALEIDANEQIPDERDARSWHHTGDESRKAGTEFAFELVLEDIQHCLACDQLLRGRFAAALIDSAGAILDISPRAERASHSQCMLRASMATSR